MNKQEQIEEMATELSNSSDKHGYDLKECEIDLLALDLYDSGYRKAEEVRKETAKVILEIMSNIICEMYGEDAPCNYNDIDEYMFNNCRNYCDKNCTNGHFANCWKMFLKAKIKEYGVEVEE